MESDERRLLQLILKDWQFSSNNVDIILSLYSHSFDTALSLCSNAQLRQLSSDLISTIKALRAIFIKIANQEEEVAVKLREELNRLDKELQ